MNEQQPLSEALPELIFSDSPIAYPDAVSFMENRVAQIVAGTAGECLWFLEHPPLYTGGTSARPQDLLDAGRFPVYPTGRGGQYTYHGPGQRVVYLMLDLKPRGGDVRGHVRALEQWVIDALARFGVTGERRDGRVGIWNPPYEELPGTCASQSAAFLRVAALTRRDPWFEPPPAPL